MNTDETFMQRCLDLASNGKQDVAPNPMVGAVIVHQGEIIGEGYHQFYGGPHAEVNAVNAVKDLSLLKESTIYVSLEPCAHFGKTPPCVDLILENQFKRVVIGCLDPHDQVAGKSVEKLQKNNIEVRVGVLEAECLKINKRFFKFHQKQLPHVILKWAQTQDGFIDGIRDSEERKINWISAPETKVLVHQWRSEEQAILVGWKTINNDNPSLTVREVVGKNPIRVILDSHLKCNPNSTVFTDGLKTIVFNTLKDETVENVDYIKLKDISTKTVLKALYELKITSVFVEGGSSTLQHFLTDKTWDEARVIVGKNNFGEGVKAPEMTGIPELTFEFAGDTIYQFQNK
ncbi:MAG: bifunctional diaminohydroxyphosphoribosylaminopyrimidine deaminase/5-amino-6-(5-phosphoribosylamino)uracil reductase RibD [Crocinitomicaceae bacterium]|nr:bifunctional diaminohydroxyphosphoribosylaminopyrimidine deaminase/5-amino-6-(5-phosphoribosylamino)uracil reductase RibD [Crocinitomicaceae bacterium]